MPTKAKIKITDDSKIRKEIDLLYEQVEHIDLAKWALAISKHIMNIADIDYESIEDIANGFKINEEWQKGKARMHDVRQAGFAANRIARECKNEVKKAAMRASVQSIGSGHMREHAMVTSDYAIKVINLLYPDNMDEVTAEREWQFNELKKYL